MLVKGQERTLLSIPTDTQVQNTGLKGDKNKRMWREPPELKRASQAKASNNTCTNNDNIQEMTN